MSNFVFQVSYLALLLVPGYAAWFGFQHVVRRRLMFVGKRAFLRGWWGVGEDRGGQRDREVAGARLPELGVRHRPLPGVGSEDRQLRVFSPEFVVLILAAAVSHGLTIAAWESIRRVSGLSGLPWVDCRAILWAGLGENGARVVDSVVTHGLRWVVLYFLAACGVASLVGTAAGIGFSRRVASGAWKGSRIQQSVRLMAETLGHELREAVEEMRGGDTSGVMAFPVLSLGMELQGKAWLVTGVVHRTTWDEQGVLANAVFPVAPFFQPLDQCVLGARQPGRVAGTSSGAVGYVYGVGTGWPEETDHPFSSLFEADTAIPGSSPVTLTVERPLFWRVGWVIVPEELVEEDD